MGASTRSAENSLFKGTLRPCTAPIVLSPYLCVSTTWGRYFYLFWLFFFLVSRSFLILPFPSAYHLTSLFYHVCKTSQSFMWLSPPEH